MSTPTTPVPLKELRAQLFKTLEQRTDDPEVRRRLDAVVLELRLMAGVGERPVGSARAQDPVVDLLLRLLGIGDDADKDPDLATPLTAAQTRAAWVATRVFVDPEAEDEAEEAEDPAPEWVVATAQKEKERTIIGWKPDEAELDDIDPDAALAELERGWDDFEEDPPTEITGGGPVELEPPEPTDGSLVSFGDSEGFDEAMANEFYDVNERFAQADDDIVYQASGQGAGPAVVDVASDWDDAESDAQAIAEVAERAGATPAPAPAPAKTATPAPAPKTATPAPAPKAQAAQTPDDTEAARRRAIFEAADKRIGTDRPADPRDVIPTRTPAPAPPPEEQQTDRLAQQRNLGLILAAGGLLLLLVLGSFAYGAFQGSISVNGAAAGVDQYRSALYNTIESDTSLVESVAALGANEALLRERWLAFNDANAEERARRALAFARALDAEWRQIKPGGSRYLRVEQPVKRIAKARSEYERSVEHWAAATQSPLGALATTVGLARSPAPDALVPLE